MWRKLKNLLEGGRHYNSACRTWMTVPKISLCTRTSMPIQESLAFIPRCFLDASHLTFDSRLNCPTTSFCLMGELSASPHWCNMPTASSPWRHHPGRPSNDGSILFFPHKEAHIPFVFYVFTRQFFHSVHDVPRVFPVVSFTGCPLCSIFRLSTGGALKLFPNQTSLFSTCTIGHVFPSLSATLGLSHITEQTPKASKHCALIIFPLSRL